MHPLPVAFQSWIPLCCATRELALPLRRAQWSEPNLDPLEPLTLPSAAHAIRAGAHVSSSTNLTRLPRDSMEYGLPMKFNC